jgi:hypothetical protein
VGIEEAVDHLSSGDKEGSNVLSSDASGAPLPEHAFTNRTWSQGGAKKLYENYKGLCEDIKLAMGYVKPPSSSFTPATGL